MVSRTAVLPPELVRLPAELTLLTYMFLHGGWMHLIGNMAFLAVFGDNVEDALGHLRYAIFYLACGVVGELTHISDAALFRDPAGRRLGGGGRRGRGLSAAAPQCPALGADLHAHPAAHPRSVADQRLDRVPGMEHRHRRPNDGTAFWAHIGGLIAGAVLVVFLRRKGVPLLVRTPDGTPPPAAGSPH